MLFVIPIVGVLLVGLFFVGRQIGKGNYKEAAFNGVRTIVYGSVVLLVLFVVYAWLFYSGGGH